MIKKCTVLIHSINERVLEVSTEVRLELRYELPSSAFVEGAGSSMRMSIPNLPKGMTFDGKAILGQPPSKDVDLEVDATNAAGGVCSCQCLSVLCVFSRCDWHLIIVYYCFVLFALLSSFFRGLTASAPLHLDVSKTGGSDEQLSMEPVTASSLPDAEGTVGKVMSYTVPQTTFVDHHGGKLTLSAVDMPPWLSFDGKNISGTPPEEGTFTLQPRGLKKCQEVNMSSSFLFTFSPRIKATNQLGLSDSEPLRVHVKQPAGRVERFR